MPRRLISGLSWMWVLGKRPPLIKKIFTPNKSTATPTRRTMTNKVANTCLRFTESLSRRGCRTCRDSNLVQIYKLLMIFC